jgi:CHAD domain-containing protein
MGARLPADLLTRPVEEGGRLVALSYLDEIGRAVRRLNQQDPEALHDFRVGLRRLRSCIKAYRAPLKGSVSKKVRRRLRELTLDTNANRDTEVQLAWLRRQAGKLGPGETEGLAWLIGWLEGRQHDARVKVTANVAERFAKTAAGLRARLGTVKLPVRTGRAQARFSFGKVTGELVSSHVEQLGESLQAVSNADQKTEAHSARIAAKRLRYLLEPLSRRVQGAKSLVGRLKQLQDVLGDLHDMQVLGEEIGSSQAALSKVDSLSNAMPGLLSLQRLALEHAGLAFASFDAHWGGDHSTGFLERATELGRSLQGIEETPGAAVQPPSPVHDDLTVRRPKSPALHVG